MATSSASSPKSPPASMPTKTIQVGAELENMQEDRYSRFRLIPWWDQEKIRATRVLVIGAGALGNEILKNLALLGFIHIVVVDLDSIEVTNLSRAILFSEDAIGHPKADVVAAAYEKLLPEATVTPIVANILHDLGLGAFLWSDLILAGLDNREARLFINRAASSSPASRPAMSARSASRTGPSSRSGCPAISCFTKPTPQVKFRLRRQSHRSSLVFRPRKP
jgi:hypothetical protein